MATSMKKPSAQEALSFAEKPSKAVTAQKRPRAKAVSKKATYTESEAFYKAVTKSASTIAKTGMEMKKDKVTGKSRLNANIPPELHMKLRMAAAARGVSIGKIVEELVEKHL